MDLRREFTAVMEEAEAATEAAGEGAAEGGSGGGPMVYAEPQQLHAVLPLLSLTTTALSFSTLTRVLFRIAFRYK